MNSIHESIYARIDDVENGCCPGAPVEIWKALHVPSGKVTFSAVCSCGGWCTNGHSDPWDALEEYQQMTEEEKRRSTEMRPRSKGKEEPEPGPFSEVATSYLKFILNSDFEDRLLNEVCDHSADECRKVQSFTMEAYRAGYAAGRNVGIEEAADALSRLSTGSGE